MTQGKIDTESSLAQIMFRFPEGIVLRPGGHRKQADVRAMGMVGRDVNRRRWLSRLRVVGHAR
jgi:hypothetical protein